MSKEKSIAETGKGNAKDHSNGKYAEITTKHRHQFPELRKQDSRKKMDSRI